VLVEQYGLQFAKTWDDRVFADCIEEADRGFGRLKAQMYDESSGREPMSEKKVVIPEGYMPYQGKPMDMLGKTELWTIHENRAEPDMIRIPQDLVDSLWGESAKRVPVEWGKLLYYKVV
jgi:hypothetical protein